MDALTNKKFLCTIDSLMVLYCFLFLIYLKKEKKKESKKKHSSRNRRRV